MRLREVSAKRFARILFCLVVAALATSQATIFAAPTAIHGKEVYAVLEKSDELTNNESKSARAGVAVMVGGRVVNMFGRGVASATVTLLENNGKKRSVRTNPFGFYRFYEVPAGDGYIFYVEAKRYIFEPRFVPVENDMFDLNFVAEP